MKKETRNGHAFHPIMRKGGVHEKTHKAKRKAERQQMEKKVNEYLAKGISEVQSPIKGNKKAADDFAAFFYLLALA